VVLGDSTVVNASASQNSDLWKALKGGGNNFGIVTRYDLYTVPLHDLWYKGITFNATQASTVLPAIVQTQNNMESDANAGIIIQVGFGAFQVVFIYAKHVGATPSVFKPLDALSGSTVAIPPTNGTALSFSNSESAPEPPG
jgi:FAD/FMN-containing dehydrogenase